MRQVLLFLSLLLCSVSLWADDVSPEQALQIASRYASTSSRTMSKLKKSPDLKVSPQMAHAVRSKHVQKDNVYVVNLGDSLGFVIVSGTDGTASEILGFCDHGSFDYENSPVQLKDLLQSYANDIDALRANPDKAERRKAAPEKYETIVEPLVKTTWNQNDPYNRLCPDGCPTGCVNTALAQIMNYWQWPEKGKGFLDEDNVEIGAPTSVYQWDKMKQSYEYSYTGEEAQAVALLMRDIGRANGTSYTPTESPSSACVEVLRQVFSYDFDSPLLFSLTNKAFGDSIRQSLNAGRPVYYVAYPVSGDGHALVCDGYATNDYFHFNYGWGGQADGFYQLGALAYSFNNHISLLVNIKPNRDEVLEIDGLNYKIVGDEAHVVEGIVRYTDDVNVTIPDSVTFKGKNYPVTYIRPEAFMRTGSNFDTVILGKNVRGVGKTAFMGRTVKTLILNANLREVEEKAFRSSEVTDLTLGGGVLHVGPSAFEDCRLSNVIANGTIIDADERSFSLTNIGRSKEAMACFRSVGEKAFANVWFSEVPNFSKLESIGPNVFAGATVDCGYVNLPACLRKISPEAFHGANFRKINIDAANPYYVGYEWELLTKDNHTLVAYLPNHGHGDYDYFPEKMVRIDANVIPNVNHVFTIPNTVVEMEGAFAKCEKLKALDCCCVTPPVISDATFNDKIFTNDPTVYLTVPKGSKEAYRKAPGWRKFHNFAEDSHFSTEPAPEPDRENYMVTHVKGEDAQNVCTPFSQIREMKVTADGDDLNMVLRRTSGEDLICNVLDVDSVTWQKGFLFGNETVHEISETQLIAQGREASVIFDAVSIGAPTQVSIREMTMPPAMIPDAVSGKMVDITLADGTHELEGVAQVAIDMPCDANHMAVAAYFNEKTGSWDPIPFEYDEKTQQVVILTSHLSQFGAFLLEYDNSYRMAIAPLSYYAFPYKLFPIYEAAANLKEILFDTEDEKLMWDTFKESEALWKQLGFDFGFNAFNGIGVESDFLGKFQNAVGNLGTVISILDILHADYTGDTKALTASVLSTAQDLIMGQLTSTFATATLSASMSVVALVGLALNEFGTAVTNSQEDKYRHAYQLFFSKQGGEITGHNYYKSATDWFREFYPIFDEALTEGQLKAKIEEKVNAYCNLPWEMGHADEYNMCVAESNRQGFNYLGMFTESLRNRIAEEFKTELYNGLLFSVFQTINNKMKEKTGLLALEKQKKYVNLMNRVVEVYFTDSSCKEGEKSAYEGMKLKMVGVDGNDENKAKWECAIDENGKGAVKFRVLPFVLYRMPGELMLEDVNGDVTASYKFKIPAPVKGEARTQINIDLATAGVQTSNPKLKGINIDYNPATISFDGDFEYLAPENTLHLRQRTRNCTFYTKMVARGDSIGCFAYRATDKKIDSGHLNSFFNMKTNIHAAVIQYFIDHNKLEINPNGGDIKLGNDLFAKYDAETKKGSGTFKFDTSMPFVEQSRDDYEEPELVNYIDVYNCLSSPKDDRVLSGTMEHHFKGTFDVVYNESKNEFEVTFNADGDYQLDAEVVSLVLGPDERIDWSFFGMDDYYTRKSPYTIGATRNDTFKGTAKLTYTFTVKNQ